MLDEQQLIAKLQERSKQIAVEGLKRPKRKDSFEYGELAGQVQGLAIAEALIIGLLSTEEDSGNSGNKQRPRKPPY